MKLTLIARTVYRLIRPFVTAYIKARHETFLNELPTAELHEYEPEAPEVGVHKLYLEDDDIMIMAVTSSAGGLQVIGVFDTRSGEKEKTEAENDSAETSPQSEEHDIKIQG